MDGDDNASGEHFRSWIQQLLIATHPIFVFDTSCVQPCDFGTTIERVHGDGRVSGPGTKVSPLFLVTRICSHVSFGLRSSVKSIGQTNRCSRRVKLPS